METKDIQMICDDCCDDIKVSINNEYIKQIFQWLIDNDYVITKNK